jgi:hypothetical protein
MLTVLEFVARDGSTPFSKWFAQLDGKAILRDYINATIGFEELSRLTGRPAKSLMRMLGPRGNPQARNLFEVIGHLQRIEGLHFELSLRAAS